MKNKLVPPEVHEQRIAANRFLRSISRDEIEMFLADVSSPKCELMVAMLQDPAYRSKTLAQMCKLSGLSMTELQHIVMDGLKQLALMNMHADLPHLMDDVVHDARSHMETCPRCDGLQVLPFGENGTRPCPSCKGAGEIKRVGDRHARDLIFESAKLTGQKGPMVAIQNNVAVSDERLESLFKRTRQILLESPEESS
jgi:hypothetical protein